MGNAHLQTILPSYTRKCEKVDYQREVFTAPDKMDFYLDWAKVGGDCLVVVNHGLCGHSRRHYALSTVKTFNDIGWDVLVWNYRGTGPSPVTGLSSMTTNNSTDHLGWVLEHAIVSGHYRKVALVGFSMGGNLNVLYLGREAASIPNEVVGSVSFCATIDINASSRCFNSFMGKIYCAHFMKHLRQIVIDMAKVFPDKIDLTGIEDVKTIQQYDDRYTAQLCGFKDAEDYWTTASGWQWIHQIQVPSLVVNPINDPFMDGKCYPKDEAAKSNAFYLEMPTDGGHCGFITSSSSEWWPMQRTKQFLSNL